jgi:hypothetical protein
MTEESKTEVPVKKIVSRVHMLYRKNKTDKEDVPFTYSAALASRPDMRPGWRTIYSDGTMTDEKEREVINVNATDRDRELRKATERIRELELEVAYLKDQLDIKECAPKPVFVVTAAVTDGHAEPDDNLFVPAPEDPVAPDTITAPKVQTPKRKG